VKLPDIGTIDSPKASNLNNDFTVACSSLC